jgi:alpha-glucosidase
MEGYLMTESTLWWRDGVIYQIYPRSFADSNGDGIGDLPGITSHLDYLADLGIDAIWLSPIYPSPDADFGYDVSNYVDIAPHFGNLKDFDRLVTEAHRRNIHIIMDMVFNHTSDQHPWFQASRSSRDNPYHDWYMWHDPKPGGGPPNNWQSVFGGGGWEYDPILGQYYFHMFVKEQPDLNWRNPKVKQAVLDAYRFWLDRGVDGFRLDVFNVYYKHADLPDNPPRFGIRGFDRQRHIYDCDQPEMHTFLAELRALLDSYPERYAVGETFLESTEKAASYCGADRLHATFDFSFTSCKWNPRQYLKTIMNWEKALGPNKWPNYVLNNHDVVRSATRYGWHGNDAPAKVAQAMLLTLRGTPFMYYGEEIGMQDIRLRRDEILDPPGKRYWPFYKGRDGCRSPMQWNDTQNAGFGAGKPWLPVHPNYIERNIQAQSADPESLLNFTRRLIQLRRKTPALYCGSFTPLTEDPQNVLAYLRQSGQQKALIVLNFSNSVQKIRLNVSLIKENTWKLALSSDPLNVPELVTNELMLNPYQVNIYISG